MTETALVTTEHSLPAEIEVQEALANIAAFRKLVHANLEEGVDYGPPFPGSDRPGLLKPGAEKVTKLLKCTATYEVVETVADWQAPIFAWVMKCRLVRMDTGEIWSEGSGEANSMEGRHRYRNGTRTCPTAIEGSEEICGQEIRKSKRDPEWYCWVKTGGCGATFPIDAPVIVDQQVGKVLNDDIYALRNTILKMAEKRALVSAALAGGRLSDIFTQDVEDMAGGAPVPSGNGQATMAVEVEQVTNNGAKPEGAGDVEPVLNSVGDLLNACLVKFGKRGDEVFAVLDVHAAAEIKDFKEAWATCKAHWGE
jgi:hypothetical protein